MAPEAPRDRDTDADRRRVDRPLWWRARARIVLASAAMRPWEVMGLFALSELSLRTVRRGSGGSPAVRSAMVINSFGFKAGAGDVLLLEEGIREGDVERVGVAVPIGARVERLVVTLRLLELVMTTELRRRGWRSEVR